jgi:putative transcriptional regulator
MVKFVAQTARCMPHQTYGAVPVRAPVRLTLPTALGLGCYIRQYLRHRRGQGPLRGLVREVEMGHFGVSSEGIAVFEIILIQELEPDLVAGRITRTCNQKLGGAGFHRTVSGDESNRLHIAGPVPEILVNRFGHGRVPGIEQIVGDDDAALVQRRRRQGQIAKHCIPGMIAIDAYHADIARRFRPAALNQGAAILDREIEMFGLDLKARQIGQELIVIVLVDPRRITEHIDGIGALAPAHRQAQHDEQAAVVDTDLGHVAGDAKIILQFSQRPDHRDRAALQHSGHAFHALHGIGAKGVAAIKFIWNCIRHLVLATCRAGRTATQYTARWLTKECRETKMAFGRLILIVILAAALTGAARAQEAAPAKSSMAGKLLVASERMRDPNFAETVIYVCRHDAAGAFGLVLNRPAGELKLADVLRSFRIDPGGDTGSVIKLRRGGPVQPDAGFILHTSEFRAGTSLCRQDGMAVSSVREVLDAFAAGERPKKSMLFFGYSGWGAGQLEQELRRKDWITTRADAAIVFGAETNTMWRRALLRRGIDL